MVYGIDIGNKYVTISVIKNGRPVIITDNEENRRFNTVIQLNHDTGKRVIGTIAYTNFINSYEYTMTNIKYAIKYEDNDHNNIPIHQNLVGIVNYCVKLCNFEGRDKIILTVPPYFGHKERQMYLDLGKILNLNISLYDESSAVSLYYGKYKNAKGNVLFIDIGDINCNVFCTSYGEKGKILYTKCKKIGGLYIDQLLFQYFCKQIMDKWGINIGNPKNIKSSIKLFNGCSELKTKINSQVYIDNLFGGKDYILQLDKNIFNKLIKEQLDSLIELLGECHGQIDKIELVGGTSRLPIFRETIQNYFGDIKVGTTINAVETVAKGAALYGHLSDNIFDLEKVGNTDIVIEECIPDSMNKIYCEENKKEYLVKNGEILKFDKNVTLRCGEKVWLFHGGEIKCCFKDGMMNMVGDNITSYKNGYELNNDVIGILTRMEIKLLKRNKYLHDVDVKKNKYEENVCKWINKIDGTHKQYINDNEKKDLLEYMDKQLQKSCKSNNLEELKNMLKELGQHVKVFEERRTTSLFR